MGRSQRLFGTVVSAATTTAAVFLFLELKSKDRSIRGVVERLRARRGHGRSLRGGNSRR